MLPIWGDYSKIKNALGWAPKTSFKEMIEAMVDADRSVYRGLFMSSRHKRLCSPRPSLQLSQLEAVQSA